MTFALSATPTAGTGTISVAAGSGAVTGVGTNFSGQALNGRIIIVGRINFLVTAVASNTAMTVSPAPVTDIVADSFTFVNNGTSINQTGTDTSLAGLAALPGVLVLNIGQQTIYKLGMFRLNQSASGANLTYNANAEGLAWHPNITAPEVQSNSGRTITITGARTDGTYTANFYPRAMAMPRTGSTFLPAQSAIALATGTLNSTGVWFDVNTVEEFTGTVNITDCKWTVTPQTANVRLNSPSININGLDLYGGNLTLIQAPARLDGVRFYNASYTPVSLPATTEANPRTHSNWDFQGALPILNNFGGNNNFTEFVNLGNWDGFRVATNTVLNLAVKLTKQIEVTVKDGNGVAVPDAVVYRLDTNNGSRTFYAADEHLVLTANSSGAVAGKILAQVGRLPNGYLANSTVYTAVMDFRNAANNGTGTDVLAFASYEHLLATQPINTKGNGVRSVEQLIFADTNITLTKTAAAAKLASSLTINADTQTITILASLTLGELNDCLKLYKCSPVAAQLALPVRGAVYLAQPAGELLSIFTNWKVVINAGATLSGDPKFKEFALTGTGILTNNGSITVPFRDADGLRATVSGLDPEGFGITWHLRYRLQGTTTWTEISGTGNTALILLTEGAYDVQVRAKGYEWESALVIDTAVSLSLNAGLRFHVSANNTPQYEMPFNETLSNAFQYNAIAMAVAVSNETGAIIQPGFAELYRATQRIQHIPELVWTWVAPVTANATSQKILIPNGNPISMFLTDASTASVKITCPVIYADTGESADDRVRGNPDGFSIILGSPATAESAGLQAGIVAALGGPNYDSEVHSLALIKSVIDLIKTATDSTKTTAEALPTLAEVEASTVLAKEATVDAVATAVDALPDAAEIATQVEVSIINDDDGRAVLQAIADKIMAEEISSTIIAQSVRAELATELARIDVAVSTRSTLTPEDIPEGLTAAQVRTELTAELNRIDVAVSTRSTLTAEDIPEGLTAAEVWAAETRTLTESAGLTTEQAAQLANVETLAEALPTLTEIEASTVLAKSAQVDGVPTAAETAAAVLGATVESGATVVQSLRLANAVLGGKVSGGQSGTETFRDLADTKDVVVSTNDAAGNRTAVVKNLS